MTGPSAAASEMREAPVSTPAPRSLSQAATTGNDKIQPTRTFRNVVWWLQWRRTTWASTTASKSRLFADRRPAVALAQRLQGEGYNVGLAWARRGVWTAEELEVPAKQSAGRAGCPACSGTGVFLAGLPYERPCPTCAALSARPA